jgi:hypothetical protein
VDPDRSWGKRQQQLLQGFPGYEEKGAWRILDRYNDQQITVWNNREILQLCNVEKIPESPDNQISIKQIAYVGGCGLQVAG